MPSEVRVQAALVEQRMLELANAIRQSPFNNATRRCEMLLKRELAVWEDMRLELLYQKGMELREAEMAAGHRQSFGIDVATE